MRSNKLWLSIASLLILTALFGQAARIVSIGGRNDSTPFFSANDRSRWCTIASLVEEHTYEIDTLIELRDNNKGRPWNSIDKVRHLGADGKQHYYSSKPPLLATIYAGVYQVIHSMTGLLLTEEPFFVGRLILLVVNLVPLGIFWFWSAFWIRDELRGLWGRTLVMLFVLWGTFLTSFGNTLSNHLPGAVAIGLSIAAWRVMEKRKVPHFGWLVVAGLATSLAVACDLPSLSWLAALLGLFVLRFGIQCIVPYGLGVVPIAIAFCVTNFVAHGELIPAYAHRSVGKALTAIERDEGSEQPGLDSVKEALREVGRDVDGLNRIQKAGRLDNLELTDSTGTIRYAIVDDGAKWTICEWGDWYDYPGSYWLKEGPKGVDRGEASQGIYAFHVLIGHHGIFSLTPFWTIGLIGAWRLLRRGGGNRDGETNRGREAQWLMLAILCVTIVCLAFYLVRPEIDRNYGGVSCGFRWAFWMIPLWLIPTMAGVEIVRKYRWTRRLVEVALAMSIFSAIYPWTNPWVHPWLFQLLSYFGWIEY